MFIVNKDYPDKKIAPEDIVCYKLLYRLDDEVLVSPWIGFKYELNVLYSIDKPLQKIPHLYANVIFDGFHSYKTELLAHEHAYANTTPVVVRCVIPRGCEYFENAYEYVSASLMMVETDYTKKMKGWEDYVL